MEQWRRCRLLNHCVFPQPEIKESIIWTERFSSTLSHVLRPLFFFLSFLETLGLLLDFLLFLSSHPVIGASGTSRQRVSTLRDAGVASLSPLRGDRTASVCCPSPCGATRKRTCSVHSYCELRLCKMSPMWNFSRKGAFFPTYFCLHWDFSSMSSL